MNLFRDREADCLHHQERAAVAAFCAAECREAGHTLRAEQQQTLAAIHADQARKQLWIITNGRRVLAP